DPVKLDDVVGDETVAARDQLERELALADRRGAGDQHAELEHVEEHAVERRRLGEHALQVDAEDVDDVRRRRLRGDEGDAVLLAARNEMRRHRLAVADDDCGELAREQPVDRMPELVFGERIEPRRLGGTDDLHAKRVDQVHVPDLADRRAQRALADQHAVAAAPARDPDEAEALPVVLDQRADGELAHAVWGPHDSNSAATSSTPAAPARRSRNGRSENICASSDRSSRWRSVASAGTSSTNDWITGLLSGASKPIGWSSRA